MKICQKCQGSGEIEVAPKPDARIVSITPLFLAEGFIEFKFYKITCPACDGTGSRISQGEIGLGDLNDFGQEGEDITNL